MLFELSEIGIFYELSSLVSSVICLCFYAAIFFGLWHVRPQHWFGCVGVRLLNVFL